MATLKEFLEKCSTLGLLRIIVTNDTAVLECKSEMKDLYYAALPKGQYANMHTENFEFHLNMDHIGWVRFEEGIAKRGNFTTYAVRLQTDTESKPLLSAFLQWGKPGEYGEGQVDAFQALKAEYGEAWAPEPLPQNVNS